MENDECIRLRKLFLIGIVMALVTIIGGEIPIGWVVNPEAERRL